MRFRSILLLAVALVAVLVPAASATDHTLSPSEGVRLPGTSLAAVNEGADLFLGDFGCNGHVVTNRFWIRQNATGILLADSPSGPLGKPPAAPHVFFPSSPSTGFLGPLPVPSSFDTPLQPGHDRVVFPAGGGNTIFALANQPTPTLTFFQTIEDGPNGLALQGSWIGALSPTDARIAQITSTGPSILFQANQPSSIPACTLVSKAETLAEKAARIAATVARDDHKVAKGQRALDWSAIFDEIADFELSTRLADRAMKLDDYKGAAGAAPLLINLEKKFDRLEVQIEIKIKNPQVKKEVTRDAHGLELALRSAASALSALS